jgi:CDP-glucose 4,6-dehydratase
MPNATRPWTLVHDVLRGYLMVALEANANMLKSNEPWNFASNERMTVGEVVKIIGKNLTPNLDLRVKNSVTFPEAKELQLDSKKSETELGWKTAFNLEESLIITANWYQNQLMGVNMEHYSDHFLHDYFLKF